MPSPFADPVTPLTRFRAITEGIATHAPSEGHDHLPLACLGAVPVRQTPHALAEGLIGHAHRLAHLPGWSLSLPVRYQIAASLLLADCPVDAFHGLLSTGHAAFRSEGLDGEAGAVALAVATILLTEPHATRTGSAAARVAQLHARFRRRHWWMTVPADLPTAAMLATLHERPAQLEDGIEAQYLALVEQRQPRGTPLHIACALLALAPDGGTHAYARFQALAQVFRAATRPRNPGGLALLALLPHEPEHVADQHLAIEAHLQHQLGLPAGDVRDLVAAGLTFLDLLPFAADGTPERDEPSRARQQRLTRLLEAALCCWMAPAGISAVDVEPIVPA